MGARAAALVACCPVLAWCSSARVATVSYPTERLPTWFRACLHLAAPVCPCTQLEPKLEGLQLPSRPERLPSPQPGPRRALVPPGQMQAALALMGEAAGAMARAHQHGGRAQGHVSVGPRELKAEVGVEVGAEEGTGAGTRAAAAGAGPGAGSNAGPKMEIK